jgi:GNAT superfamily N-acetyltransferase
MDDERKLHFHPVRLGDFHAALTLVLDDGVHPPQRPEDVDPVPYRRAFEAILSREDIELVGMWSGDALVGLLQLTVIPNLTLGGATRGLIEGVRVRGDLRGQGLGTHLMRHALARAKSKGCHLAELTTRRPEAARLYERLGFRQTHQGFKYPLDAPT